MTHTYFAEIHADKESQFNATAHNVRDTEEIAALRIKLESAPDDAELMLELAHKLEFQLRYREALTLYDRLVVLRPDDLAIRRPRAARYLATQQTAAAYDEYAVCDRLSPGTNEIVCRLGITAYMLGKYDEAAKLLSRCYLDLEETGESRVAFAYWLAHTELRSNAGGGLWRGFDFSLDVGHHTGYRQGLAVLCGNKSVEDAYKETVGSEDSLNGCIVLYALAAQCRVEGRNARAEEITAKLLAWDDFWPGFAYLAAWSEQNAK